MKNCIKCTRCGRIELILSIHVLPDGWERHNGDDYCNKCMAEIFRRLEEWYGARK